MNALYTDYGFCPVHQNEKSMHQGHCKYCGEPSQGHIHAPLPYSVYLSCESWKHKIDELHKLDLKHKALIQKKQVEIDSRYEEHKTSVIRTDKVLIIVCVLYVLTCILIKLLK